MLKILQIGLSSNPGGIESCIVNYNKYIDRKHFRFDYADIYGNGLAYADEIQKLGGTIHTLANFKKHPLTYASQLRDLVRSVQYDVIHINMLSAANMISPFIACKSHSVVIVHCHNSSMPSGLLRKFMNSVNLRWLRKLPVVKCGCGVKAGLWMWGDNFDTANVIPNAVNIDIFKKNSCIRKKLRAICDFKEDDLVMGFVGRLSEQKNVLFIPEILAALQKRNPRFKALIIGDGILRKDIEDKIAAFSLSEDVYFAGIQQKTADWYQAMDAFILPSLFEGVPVVGIEAQAAGLPCFMSDTVTNEVNVSGTVKYLPIYKGGDIWADAICHTIANKRQCHVCIPRNYQIQYAAKDLERRYECLTFAR